MSLVLPLSVAGELRGALIFARKQPLAPKPTDANRLLREFDPLIRRTIKENIDFELISAGGLWKTQVDQSQLENAVLNLAVNARDAMPEGGRLTIETANTQLDPDYADRHSEVLPGQYVMIAVSDTGHGMNAETLQEAFTLFFTTKDVGKGSGIDHMLVGRGGKGGRQRDRHDEANARIDRAHNVQEGLELGHDLGDPVGHQRMRGRVKTARDGVGAHGIDQPVGTSLPCFGQPKSEDEDIRLFQQPAHSAQVACAALQGLRGHGKAVRFDSRAKDIIESAVSFPDCVFEFPVLQSPLGKL